ncbi:MAG TPA: HIT family protein [Caulobacteraceae bacterium]|jgi:diadenosine tetraphosphate (Ap4A) HIT family hydrolase
MERRPFDLAAYAERSGGPCFVCRLVAGDPDYVHHVVHEDAAAIVFLNKYPTLGGHTLVCPKTHREQVTGDFSQAEYLELQALVWRVGEAVRRAMGAERVYVMSLGSNDANAHVHWHAAPLPPGVPLDDQQFAALDAARGVLALSEDAMAGIAARIRAELAAVG